MNLDKSVNFLIIPPLWSLKISKISYFIGPCLYEWKPGLVEVDWTLTAPFGRLFAVLWPFMIADDDWGPSEPPLVFCFYL